MVTGEAYILQIKNVHIYKNYKKRKKVYNLI